MPEEFQRELRYVVFKIKDIHRHLNDEDQAELERIGFKLAAGRGRDARAPFNAVVVEQDWPEFDSVWAMIEARMTGQPTPQDTRIAALERDLAHWKNNHATEVRRARVLKERPDLPIERVDAYEKWGEDQRRIAELQRLLISCRGSVKSDLERYERLLVRDPGGAQHAIELEAERLHELLDRIDTIEPQIGADFISERTFLAKRLRRVAKLLDIPTFDSDADLAAVAGTVLASVARAIERLQSTRSDQFQPRVSPWMLTCFGAAIADDKQERNHRFLEEALELVQACGCTQSEAHQLVDYVYGRSVGEREQEVGGVMVTLAALCLAQGLDMHAAGEKELARVWTKVEQIRAKQAAKPKHSPLPCAWPEAR